MATYTDVKAGLDEIGNLINTSRLKLKAAKAQIVTQEANLIGLPTRYADIISEINGYTPSGASETLAKDELNKMTLEFAALRDEAALANIDLANYLEF